MPTEAATATPPATLLATTATGHALPAGVIALLLLALTLGYIGSVVCWPFKACRHCSGAGKHLGRGGRRVYRICRHCNATGMRLRLGRRVWNGTRHWRGRIPR
jgi:hypothetical protein